MTAPPTEGPFRQLVEAALELRSDFPPGNAIGLWRTLAPELNSIIGERGFETLFLRCVRLTRLAHPWLRPDNATAPNSDVFTLLEQSLAAQDAGHAAQASMALFMYFFDILTSLIGEPLTKHLLRKAWSDEAADTLEINFNDD